MSTSDNNSKVDFSSINTASAQSFNEQKRLIKRLFKGEKVLCDRCKQPLKLVVPLDKQSDQRYGVFCKKHCTDIELEIEKLLS